MSQRRAVAGAVLLDLAVSPLFVWDVFTPSLGRDLEVEDSVLATVVAVGLGFSRWVSWSAADSRTWWRRAGSRC